MIENNNVVITDEFLDFCFNEFSELKIPGTIGDRITFEDFVNIQINVMIAPLNFRV